MAGTLYAKLRDAAMLASALVVLTAYAAPVVAQQPLTKEQLEELAKKKAREGRPPQGQGQGQGQQQQQQRQQDQQGQQQRQQQQQKEQLQRQQQQREQQLQRDQQQQKDQQQRQLQQQKDLQQRQQQQQQRDQQLQRDQQQQKDRLLQQQQQQKDQQLRQQQQRDQQLQRDQQQQKEQLLRQEQQKKEQLLRQEQQQKDLQLRQQQKDQQLKDQQQKDQQLRQQQRGSSDPGRSTTPGQGPAIVTPQGAPQRGFDGRGNNPGGSTSQRGIAVRQPLVVAPKIDAIRQERQRVEQKGSPPNQIVFREPGNRTIIKQDSRVIIRADESQRFQRYSTSARPFRKPDGTMETVFVRSDGTRVISIADSSGRILRRVRRLPGGREIVLFDDRPFYKRGSFITGAGIAIGVGALLALSRPTVSIARERYIVDYGRASDDEIYEAFSAPPISRLERRYTMDEIRYNPPLREYMRRVDLDEITFDTGSSTLSPDQYGKLERLARIIMRVLERDPAEVFMIEGHTDAPGEPEDNLSLSDRRAEAIADILSSEFGVPPENLVTQGYGEQELKIETRDSERQNRRVTMRRIGPLLNRDANN